MHVCMCGHPSLINQLAFIMICKHVHVYLKVWFQQS